MTATQELAPSPPVKAAAAPRASQTIRIFPRTNLIYWWPVWAWGYACAVLTYFQGIGVAQIETASGRPVLFHPSSALGWSFLLVLLLVVFFTNVRARGVYSLMLLALVALIAILVRNAPGYGALTEVLSLLRIHLNLAFYIIASSLFLVLWLVGIFLIDHMSWVKFSTGQVAEEHLLGQAVAHVFPSEGLIVRRLPDDLFRHKILGLRWLGAGTGDFLIRPAHGESLELHNVWRANAKQAVIERLIATKMTDAVH
ncbi:MAG: hypothetical protein EKK41_16140 [Hyphomicrobiales bacterium]|nr:MAG: hypothetical protein EKK41_16140 [Hyphomicrobiales bacterium]